LERLLPSFVIYPTNAGTVVTPKAEEYRAKARECEERAAQTRDSSLKQQMLEIAKTWRQMADFEENRNR
jgi:hypothetical protein